ncbi:sodium-coupled monocarboxylate transporter 1-like [Physella acuta]|uniref:sodium-coupled monocarboxylate transporter 1-like n=1 Tax=Physella acuta TaxID=109671 RepID=UPI0027DBE754|nr:sodium-coupled monocarboxylate transporter 1-like [Physella acuta]
MKQEVGRFSVADYIVFSATLLISAAIGIFYAIKGQTSTKQFLMADRSMKYLPIALSVLASFFSASTLLGTPAEIYQYGTMYWVCVFGSVFAPLTGALLFGPMFFNIKVVSVFQYLELRFHSKLVRLFGAFIFLLRATIGMGIVLYGPSTALSAVTEFPTWAVIVVVGVVCTFYTSIGGLKAVIWTDVFQTLVMLAGMVAVLIKGFLVSGGGADVWDVNYRGKRIEFFNFDFDPRVRHTFWSLIIGIFFVWLPPYTVDQQMVQRFSSAQSLKDAKIALLLNIPGMVIMITLCCLTGLTLFAYYANCDPIKQGLIDNPNQLLPYFVMDILGSAPGLPGLFVSSLFSGALSSVSSMLNSLAAVTWEDFMKPYMKNVKDDKATKITKGLAVMYGALGIGVAFLVKELGGTVLQASLTLNGAAGAPLVGLFILGSCFTSTNWIGALVGGALGLGFSLWLSVGTYVYKPINFKLPVTTAGCNLTGNTSETFSFADTPDYTNWTRPSTDSLNGLENLYGLSYLWFSALGTLSCVVIGLIVSLVTGPTKASEVDPSLQLRLFHKLAKLFTSPFSSSSSVSIEATTRKESRSQDELVNGTDYNIKGTGTNVESYSNKHISGNSSDQPALSSRL